MYNTQVKIVFVGLGDFDLLRMNGAIKDEVSIANLKLSDINCSIDIARDEYRLPYYEYKRTCTVLDVLNSQLELLLDLEVQTGIDLSEKRDPECKRTIGGGLRSYN